MVVGVDCTRYATGRKGVAVSAYDAMAATVEQACEGEALCHVDARDEDGRLVKIILIILAGVRLTGFRSQAIPKKEHQCKEGVGREEDKAEDEQRQILGELHHPGRVRIRHS